MGYERARGKRVLGQTADAGFQVGVRRSVLATPTAAWKLITSRPELWLGKGASIAFDEGRQYEVASGDGGLSRSGSGKTTITVHLEKLPDADAREAMRRRWREALERIVTALAHPRAAQRRT